MKGWLFARGFVGIVLSGYPRREVIFPVPFWYLTLDISPSLKEGDLVPVR